ncbi:MAG: hypothetical protein PHC29_08410 [Candidatus Omnitrophica bacterium]|nr:hypothetical protein [Candidatus Omnitrophota bacterium]
MAKEKEEKPIVAEESLPKIYLTDKDLADIRNWKVGGKYRISMDVEQVSQSIGDEMLLEAEGKRGKPKVSASFVIKSIKANSKDKPKERVKDNILKGILEEKSKKY